MQVSHILPSRNTISTVGRTQSFRTPDSRLYLLSKDIFDFYIIPYCSTSKKIYFCPPVVTRSFRTLDSRLSFLPNELFDHFINPYSQTPNRSIFTPIPYKNTSNRPCMHGDIREIPNHTLLFENLKSDLELFRNYASELIDRYPVVNENGDTSKENYQFLLEILSAITINFDQKYSCFPVSLFIASHISEFTNPFKNSLFKALSRSRYCLEEDIWYFDLIDHLRIFEDVFKYDLDKPFDPEHPLYLPSIEKKFYD